MKAGNAGTIVPVSTTVSISSKGVVWRFTDKDGKSVAVQLGHLWAPSLMADITKMISFWTNR